jgi:TolB-like protein
MTVTTQMLEVHQDGAMATVSSNDWTHEEVREELGRILRSRFFIKSMRLSCFLSTAVDYLLDGKADSFKEYTVGVEVYKRASSYDPTQDTIVRTEARRLRNKLKEYYSSFPEQCRVRIALATGSYVPLIEMRYPSRFAGRLEAAGASLSSFLGEAFSIGVVPFSMRSAEPTLDDFARNLEAELTHELAMVPTIKVFRTSVGGWESPAEQLCSWGRSGVQFALHGHVHQSLEGAVAQIQLTTMQGMILWSARFSSELMDGQSSKIASTVRAAICDSTALESRAMFREFAFNN